MRHAVSTHSLCCCAPPCWGDASHAGWSLVCVFQLSWAGRARGWGGNVWLRAEAAFSVQFAKK